MAIKQGYISHCDYEKKFDDNGIAYLMHTITLNNENFTIRSANNNAFNPAKGRYIVFEVNEDSNIGLRALITFPLKGTGKNWKQLKKLVHDEKYFYDSIIGVVKHKELKSEADDLSKDGYTGSQSFKIVLENGDYFMVSSREGKRIKAGDKVQKLIADEYGFGLIRNLTTGYTTKSSLISTIIVSLLIIAAILICFYLTQLPGELDAGKIAIIVIVAFIPLSLSSLLYKEFITRPRLLKIMSSYESNKKVDS